MGMVHDGTARCVPGNHENKLGRALSGRNVQITHGLAETLAQLDSCDDAFRAELVSFLDGLVSHAVLDDGKLVVAHAGLPEKLQGRASGRVRSFALYGETTGETDEFGLPIRYPWADDYRGKAMVVYGHTPVPEPEWVNNTICIDTGCVFGGSLTVLRYPERELRSVPAARAYYEPLRPLHAAGEQATRADDRPADLLDVSDVLGKRIIDTPLQRRITINEENATAALEVMSRFAIDPRWLIYLPPTMAPTATSRRPDLLEHPEDAFSAFLHDGIDQVICEEKHMGSRAVAIVCRDETVAPRRFRIESESGGVIYTRTGRPFFTDAAWEAQSRRAPANRHHRRRAVGRARHRLDRPRLRAASVERQSRRSPARSIPRPSEQQDEPQLRACPRSSRMHSPEGLTSPPWPTESPSVASSSRASSTRTDAIAGRSRPPTTFDSPPSLFSPPRARFTPGVITCGTWA